MALLLRSSQKITRRRLWISRALLIFFLIGGLQGVRAQGGILNAPFYAAGAIFAVLIVYLIALRLLSEPKKDRETAD